MSRPMPRNRTAGTTIRGIWPGLSNNDGHRPEIQIIMTAYAVRHEWRCNIVDLREIQMCPPARIMKNN